MAFVPENNENGEALDPYNLAARERSRGNTPVKKSTKKKFLTKAQHQTQLVMAGKKRRRTTCSSKTATYVKGAKKRRSKSRTYVSSSSSASSSSSRPGET
jgi:Tfp pilus assembly major pilin PilA